MENKLMPYEFHITVDADGINVDNFKEACKEISVKPIVLDLGVNNGRNINDVMTSSTLQLESDQCAFEEMNRIGDSLEDMNFNVVRRKIETAPWHYFAPQILGDTMPEGSYFESHLAILCDVEEVETLREGIMATADTIPLHLSRNIFKQAVNGRFVIMSTLRSHEDPFAIFNKKVEESVERIGELGFELTKKPIVEFSLYDSNTGQDSEWMKRK